MSAAASLAAADPAAKPILLCLTGPGGLDGWIQRLSGLGAFLILEAHDLTRAAEMARNCRPDLLVLDPAGFGDLPAECGDRFPSSPLGRLPVACVLPPGQPAPKGAGPAVEDILAPDLPAPQAAIRLRAVLRRKKPTALTARLRWGAVELRQDERILLVDGRPVALGYGEFNLLALLMEAPDQVWTRQELCRALWGPRPPTGSGALTRLVQGLRRRIAPALGRAPVLAVRGTGYRLAPRT